MVSFTCKTSDIEFSLKNLRPAIPSSKAKQIKLICELEFQPNKLNITVPGSTVTCPTQTNIIAKAFVPFIILKGIIGDWKDEVFTLSIDKGTIFGGRVNVESKQILVIHPENQRKIDLPINYKTLDILKLREEYTSDELKRRNLLSKVEEYERIMNADICAAIELVGKYGFTFDELEELARDKIKRHKL